MGRRGHKAGVRAAVVLAFTAALLVPPGVGQSAISVCSNYRADSYFAGTGVDLSYTQLHYYEGTSANMVYQWNNLCSTCSWTLGDCDNNNSSAWDMLSGYNIGHAPYGWAQSGIILEPPQNPHGDCRHHFAQQMRDMRYYLPYTWYGSCIAYPGVWHHLWQQTVYNGATGVSWSIRSNIDTTVALDSKTVPTYRLDGTYVGTGWSHLSVWDFPFAPQWFGETKWGQSDVPGLTANQKTEWHGVVQVQDYSDNAWHDTCTWTGAKYSTADFFRYDHLEPNCNWFQSWTI